MINRRSVLKALGFAPMVPIAAKAALVNDSSVAPMTNAEDSYMMTCYNGECVGTISVRGGTVSYGGFDGASSQ